jgi:hypothetical protein
MPDVFSDQRLQILGHPWVMVEGRMQNVDNVVHILAQRVLELGDPVGISSASHDFR